jgi:membrane protein implicated in regulation of membrane protease activity
MDIFATQPAWSWLILGILLVIVEMVTGTFFFLFLGVGALLVALLTWTVGLGSLAQLGLFGLSAAAATLAWYKVRPNPDDRIEQLGGARHLNNRLARFVGREVVLEEPIRAGQGRIRLDDSYWTVKGEDLPAGSRVRVVSVDGMILHVQAAG